MVEDPFRPLIDKTVYESYFPGSTFKPLSAIAALEDHLVDPTSRIECIGYYQVGNQRMRCTSAHGDVDMHDAIVESCNVYFWKLAEAVGLERLNRVARDFGLGERTGIGINSEARGFLASRQWYEQHYERFRVGYTLNTAIGQGNTRTTLVQLAMAYGALANGGTLFVPQLLERVQAPNGQPLEQPEAQVRRQVRVTPESLAMIRDGLIGVVHDPAGTAYEARIEGGISVAGKTGTAEVAPGSSRMRQNDRRAWYFQRAHAWFAGFAPAEEPEVAIVVLVEHGGAGGRTAAPIAMQILQEYLGERSATAMNAPAPAARGAL
jgi:penicillin-binding protein 2